jgi:steroid 5-alpha reductase family enzyme
MLHPLIAAFCWMVVVMASAWLTQRVRHNGGWVDVFWTYGTGIMGAALALWPHQNAFQPRQFMVAGLIALWSLRLGTHVAIRVAHGPEDPRYVELRQAWGKTYEFRMFWFLQVQSIVSTLLGIAVFEAAHNPRPGFGVADSCGAALLVIGIVGEAIADDQLRRFRAKPANRGLLCTAGLWGWSRHPNYFFEWVLWLAYPVVALADRMDHFPAWLSLDAPVIMYWVLVYATGIPYLEARMARSYATQFEAYRQRTSMFFLRPPKRRA